MTAQTFSTTMIAASARLSATGFARPREDSALSRGRDGARMTLHSGPIATTLTFVASVAAPFVPATIASPLPHAAPPALKTP